MSISLYIIYICLGILALATVLYGVIYHVQKTRAINRAFWLTGYSYVAVFTKAGPTYKGFLTQASIRLFDEGDVNTTLQLKFHRDGDSLIIPMQNIERIGLVRPPLFHTSFFRRYRC